MIDGPTGPLEVVLNVPEAPPAGVALVTHPHSQQGGTLDNKVVQTLAKTFFALGYGVARFNFRGVGASGGTFDDGNGETDDALAVLAHAQQELAMTSPVVLAGFSFGAFVQTRVAKHLEAQGLVLVGPAVGRFPAETVPPDTLVIHGEQDDVVPLAAVLDWARPQNLPVVVVPGGEHFFHGRLTQLADLVLRYFHP